MILPRLSVAIADALLAMSASGRAQGVLYYSRADSSVAAIDARTRAEVKVINSATFTGANPGAARNVAFDPETRLLWYSATDGNLHSLHVDTLAAGPSISNVEGVNIGASRHVFIDYARRKIITPLTDSTVKFYNLSDLQPSGSIPSGFFTDGAVGGFRHLASDIRSGTLWYAATDGSFREMNPDTTNHTGRTIPFSVQTGANPGAARHFVVDPVRDQLLFAVTDGSIASVNLTTLLADTFTIPSNAFNGANPGAGMNITFDIQPLIFGIQPGASAGLATLTWRQVGGAVGYTVEFRDAIASGGWAPVAPVNQWPTTQTGFSNFTASGSVRFFRISIGAAP